VAHGFMTALSGSQINPPALPEVADFDMKIVVYSHSYLEPENQKNINALAAFSTVRVVLPRWGSVLVFQKYKFRTRNSWSDLFCTFQPIYLYRSQYLLKTITMGLHRFRPDIINVEYNPWSVMFLQVVISRTLFARHAKIVCTVKKNTFRRGNGFLGYMKDWLAKCSLRWVDHIIAASEMAARLLEIEFSYPSHKITVCHHLGVDTSLFKPIDSELTDIGNPIIIGYCGRFDADKGVSDLIEAVRRVKKQIAQPVVLKLLGVGTYGKSLDSQLEQEARKTDWIELLSAVPNTEVASFLQKIDIFVLPSRKLDDHQEHDAHALLEALASGVACIGTNSGIIPEILCDGSGLIVNPESPDELAKALIKLINRPEERQKLALLGRRKAESEFALKEVARKKILLFEEL
jgi:glycosyltransferase involved in cell wall biosynthesis